MAHSKPLNFWGWGYVGEGLNDQQKQHLQRAIEQLIPPSQLQPIAPPNISQLPNHQPISTPASSDQVEWYTDLETIAVHSCGKSSFDLARWRAGQWPSMPTAVAFPKTVDGIIEVLEFVDKQNLALVPFGSGSTVTGGVECRNHPNKDGWLSLDLSLLDQCLEIDPISKLAHFQAGVLGPQSDQVLREQGLAMRHFPQSYQFSTVGGWVATRSAGHYATGRCKIEDRLNAVGVCLPNGTYHQTSSFPNSSVGPDPNAIWAGSEGTLGIITDAWLQVVDIPEASAQATLICKSFEQALDVVRLIVQSDLRPTQCRALDPVESMLSAILDPKFTGAGQAIVLLGYEGQDPDWVQTQLDQTIKLIKNNGGDVQVKKADPGQRSTQTSSWKSTFFRQPYIRDALLDIGILSETFETATNWRTAMSLYKNVRDELLQKLSEISPNAGVSCRLTHAYPDGCALYFTFFLPSQRDRLVTDWQMLKTFAGNSVNAHHGTASHHHACGRDHMPWANQETPTMWHDSFAAIKQTLDPGNKMNPGVFWTKTS